jgi:hypothetical protein
MIRRLARVTTGRRSRWAVVAAWVALAVACAPLAMKLNGEKVDQATTLLPDDSDSARVTETLAERFTGGSGRATVLLYHRPGGLLLDDQRRIVRDAAEASRVPLAGSAIPAFQLGVIGLPTPAAPELISRDGATAFSVVAAPATSRPAPGSA